jgi:predicted metalloenzyme YecM
MSAIPLKKQFSDAFNAYAQEGISAYKGDVPSLSHVCFKFSSLEKYTDYVEAARGIGRVTQEEFNGKQITWCRLTEPLKKGDLTLEWLELVEPRTEKNPFDGVANIGYCVPSLADPVKKSSADKEMLFRYQAIHAEKMAPR